MRNHRHIAVLALVATTISPSATYAARGCVKEPTPYYLADDVVEWSLALDPGSNCIQSLQVSKNRVYSIAVTDPPVAGELILVGPAFRYFAKSDFPVADKFTMIIYGRNGQGEGFSTVEVTVSPSAGVSSKSSIDVQHGRTGERVVQDVAAPGVTFTDLLTPNGRQNTIDFPLRTYERAILGLPGGEPGLSLLESRKSFDRQAEIDSGASRLAARGRLPHPLRGSIRCPNA